MSIAMRPESSSEPAANSSDPRYLAESRRPSEGVAEGSCPLDSRDLLQGRREALIEHRGQMYRLRLTASGKLYLTK